MNNLLSFLCLTFVLSSGIYSQYEDIVCEEESLGPRISALRVLKPMDRNLDFPPVAALTNTPVLKTPGKNKDPDELKAEKIARAQAQTWFTWSIDSMNLVGLSYTLSNLISSEQMTSHRLFAVRVSEILDLNDTTLEITKRMYCLYILQVLLEYGPTKELDCLRTGNRSGAVSRAALELSLTKGFDLASEAENIRKNGINRMDPILLEAFQRVDLLDRIQRSYRQTGASHPSKKLMKLHDDLLMASCPIERPRLISLTEDCIQHIIAKDVSEEEKQITYELMNHLFQHSYISKKILESQKSAHIAIKKLYDELNKWKKIRREISCYLSSNKVDLYIVNLLLPFLGAPLPTLDHYKYILMSFAAHTKAKVQLETHLQKGAAQKVLRGTHGQLRDTDSETEHAQHISELSTFEQTSLERAIQQADQEDYEFDLQQYVPQNGDCERYKKDQSFVIKILNMASPHIKGARTYLKERRVWTDEGNSSQIHRVEEELCTICRHNFLLGQRVVKVDCLKHVYHHSCIKGLLQGRGTVAHCPLCRKEIRRPLSIDKHIFWQGSSESPEV